MLAGIAHQDSSRLANSRRQPSHDFLERAAPKFSVRIASPAMKLVLLDSLCGECRSLFFGLPLFLRKGHPFANDFSARLVVIHLRGSLASFYLGMRGIIHLSFTILPPHRRPLPQPRGRSGFRCYGLALSLGPPLHYRHAGLPSADTALQMRPATALETSNDVTLRRPSTAACQKAADSHGHGSALLPSRVLDARRI